MAEGNATGIVLGKEKSQNGKDKLIIDGGPTKHYFAGNVDVTTIHIGQRIDFAWNTFGRDPQKPLYGLNSWGLNPNQPTPAELETSKAANASKGRKGWGGGGGAGKDRDLEVHLQDKRFVGQIVAAFIEQGLLVSIAPDPLIALDKVSNAAWNAINRFRLLGGNTSDPAPVSASASANQSAGTPTQPPGGSSQQPARVRPTGLFGYGKAHKDKPWNVMAANDLIWMRDNSNSMEIRKKCEDELWFRAQEEAKADQYKQQDPPAKEEDFDDDIPFAWATVIPLAGVLAYVTQSMFQVWSG
jgi:hypothetical protein